MTLEQYQRLFNRQASAHRAWNINPAKREAWVKACALEREAWESLDASTRTAAADWLRNRR